MLLYCDNWSTVVSLDLITKYNHRIFEVKKLVYINSLCYL